MKTVLVTGANRGLGKETARQLIKHDFFVFLGVRDLEKADDLIKDIGASNLNAKVIKLDVTKTADIKSALDNIKKEERGLDLIVSNAGVFLEPRAEQHGTLEIDPVIILKTIEVNTMGPLKIFQALVPYMIETGGGQIINISSGMGQLHDMSGHFPGYRMSKTSLNALTKMLSSELFDKGIKVNSVCPGWVKTDMGGEGATRSIEEGVETTIWLALQENPPTGKFFRDKAEIPW
jgi:NAD(P)-dependent dehydrogenase (short-subunit alcohol dehydrogenase family)